MRKLRKTAGFTVVELLVALCVMGAVGAVAAPSYVSATKTAKGSEAQANLNMFFLAQKVYRADHGKFWTPSSGTSVDTINKTLGVNLSPKEYPTFGYTGGDSSYQASFAEESNSSHRYTISELGGITQVTATPTPLGPTAGLNTAPLGTTFTPTTTDPLATAASDPTTPVATEPQDARILAILAATAAESAPAAAATTPDTAATLWTPVSEPVIDVVSDPALDEVFVKRAAAISDAVAKPVIVVDPTPTATVLPVATTPTPRIVPIETAPSTVISEIAPTASKTVSKTMIFLEE